MVDNPDIRGAGDRDRINVNQDHECRYWSDRLGVSPERLKEVVQKVGPMVKDVEAELGRV